MLNPVFIVCLYVIFVVQAAPELYDWDVLLMANDKKDLVPKMSPGRCMDVINDDMRYIVKVAWDQFQVEFNKTYVDQEEHDKRFNMFCEKFIHVREHNKAFGEGKVTYEKGINQFSDLTVEEVRLMCCGIRDENITMTPVFKYRKLDVEAPESCDWREKGAVNRVRRQGICGSCWAFSIAGAMEGHEFLHSGKLHKLSTQQMVDCGFPYGTNGCRGGHPPRAYDYIKAAGGLERDIDYPYESGDSGNAKNCRFNVNKVVSRIEGYVEVENNEEILKQALALYGPISVVVDALRSSWIDYQSGIISDPTCRNRKAETTHAILLVGYGSERGIPYWIIKNSYGKEWGEEGYGRVRRNANNMCGIASYATYPVI